VQVCIDDASIIVAVLYVSIASLIWHYAALE